MSAAGACGVLYGCLNCAFTICCLVVTFKNWDDVTETTRPDLRAKQITARHQYIIIFSLICFIGCCAGLMTTQSNPTVLVLLAVIIAGSTLTPAIFFIMDAKKALATDPIEPIPESGGFQTFFILFIFWVQFIGYCLYALQCLCACGMLVCNSAAVLAQITAMGKGGRQ